MSDSRASDPERQSLLGNGQSSQSDNPEHHHAPTTASKLAGSLLTVIVIAALITVIVGLGGDNIDEKWKMRGKPIDAARRILKDTPVIDGHIDLPELARWYYANNASKIELDKPTFGHVDIPRLREGHLGGFFWSVYVSCQDQGKDFITPSNEVRDTLEQIDVAKALIEKYPNTFQFATGTEDARKAIQDGKVASWLGVEGGHQLGTSLSVLRQYYALGVRYMTLTHVCNNVFADSAGIAPPYPEPRWNGINKDLGKDLIKEMNRLGMLVDLSHTSDQTAKDAIALSEAPVIWSHSSARAINDHVRNVPDDILKLIGEERDGKKDAVVMVNFAPGFVAPGGKGANVKVVADHIEHIAKVAGRKHVGIGSDYDGIASTPAGLEDVSRYPNLFAELISRKSGWTVSDFEGLAGGNLLRIFTKAEKVAKEIQRRGGYKAQPNWAYWKKRTDLGKVEF